MRQRSLSSIIERQESVEPAKYVLMWMHRRDVDAADARPYPSIVAKSDERASIDAAAPAPKARPLRPRKGAKPGPKRRLGEEAWFEAALELLTEGGIQEVRVDALAQRLGVTKGMFYVRFESRDAFLDGMLDHWRRRSTVTRLAELGAVDEPPADRLLRIFALSRTERAQTAAWIETALRVWAQRDPRPARVLAEIDQLRLMYVEQVLVANGVPRPEATARGFVIYSYLICDTMLPGDRDGLRELCRSFLASGT